METELAKDKDLALLRVEELSDDLLRFTESVEEAGVDCDRFPETELFVALETTFWPNKYNLRGILKTLERPDISELVKNRMGVEWYEETISILHDVV